MIVIGWLNLSHNTLRLPLPWDVFKKCTETCKKWVLADICDCPVHESMFSGMDQNPKERGYMNGASMAVEHLLVIIIYCSLDVKYAYFCHYKFIFKLNGIYNNNIEFSTKIHWNISFNQRRGYFWNYQRRGPCGLRCFWKKHTS